MRPIKFRAWNKDGELTSSNMMSWDDLLKLEANVLKMAITQYFPDTILMQFTGLKDLKGEDIYEGDIVIINGDKRQILFTDGSFWVVPNVPVNMPLWEYYDLCEVIGNIYENEDLLK